MTFSSPDAPILAGLLAAILTIVLGIRVSDGFTPGPRRGVVVDDVKPASGRSAALRVAARWRRWRIGNDIEPEAVAAWCDGLTRSLRAGTRSVSHSFVRFPPMRFCATQRSRSAGHSNAADP